MKIAHVCLAGAYTEGMSYQDNALVRVHTEDGHDVLIVSDCKKFTGGSLSDVPPEDVRLESGARLVRLPFDRIVNKYVTDKLKKAPGLIPLLSSFRPDVIFYHGIIGVELHNVAKYVRRNRSCKLYVDSHEDFHNSGRNFVSRVLQYRILMRSILSTASDVIEKIYYISRETRTFVEDLLRPSPEKLEFYPLGGFPLSGPERESRRMAVRPTVTSRDDEILFLHTGKYDRIKKTQEVLSAFQRLESAAATLVLIGSIGDDVREVVDRAIAADTRIHFLGWKTADELVDFMCACDVYLQPGGQSASLQNAICSGMPVIVYPHPSHFDFVQDNGLYVKDEEGLYLAMERCVHEPELVRRMATASQKIARDVLDYRNLAARVYT